MNFDKPRKPVDLARIEKAVAEILDAVGENSDRAGLTGTPGRVARLYAEILSGNLVDPARHLTVTFAEDHHEMVVVKLAAGVTLDEAIQADGEEGTVDREWGTNLAAPGGDEEAVTIDVEPGNYALVCFMPNADGTPHMVLGMRHEFTVS